jgi:hypothetical protein
MSHSHVLTILLYNASPDARYELEDFLLEKCDALPNPELIDWLGSGGFLDGSVQDIALTSDAPKEAFTLLKAWLKEYGVPKDTEIALSKSGEDKSEKFLIYEDD